MEDQSKLQPPSAEHLQRLAFVRYLLDIGIEQSRRPEPFASVALLTLHDAIEMFLQILLEHFDAGQQRAPDFLDYWKLLKDKNVELPRREAMRRFNSARVNLKHRGVRPAHTEIDGFRVDALNFLTETSLNILGIDLRKISLTSLVRSERVRHSLEKAEAALSAREWGTALAEAKLAFVHSINEYAGRSRSGSTTWRGFSLRGTFHPLLFDFELKNTLGRDGPTLLRAITQMATTLEEAIMVVGYNLDFEGYLLFKTHTPVAHQMLGGDIIIEWMSEPSTDPDLISRCVTFAIDTALRLEGTAQVNDSLPDRELT